MRWSQGGVLITTFSTDKAYSQFEKKTKTPHSLREIGWMFKTSVKDIFFPERKTHLLN